MDDHVVIAQHLLPPKRMINIYTSVTDQCYMADVNLHSSLFAHGSFLLIMYDKNIMLLYCMCISVGLRVIIF